MGIGIGIAFFYYLGSGSGRGFFFLSKFGMGINKFVWTGSRIGIPDLISGVMKSGSHLNSTQHFGQFDGGTKEINLENVPAFKKTCKNSAKL